MPVQSVDGPAMSATRTGDLCADLSMPQQVCTGSNGGCPTPYPTTAREPRRDPYHVDTSTASGTQRPYFLCRATSMGRARVLAALVALGVPLHASIAGPAPLRWFPVPPSALYLTGDSWSDRGITYRLYGVQSCLRGTTFTNAHGLQRDCGEASLAMLVALIRDLRPQCYDAAERSEPRTIFVFCVASRMTGAGTGSRIDLGTALIATGFAFASLKPDGQPVHAPYFVAQLVAQRAKAGLWAFPDFPDPNAIILRVLREQTPPPSPTPSTSSLPMSAP
jgi:endonuclease YncB( thermonuclease family)